MTRRARAPLARLFDKVHYPDGQDGCWLFRGANVSGYGYLTVRSNRQEVTHRIVYEAFVGPIRDGYELHHRCEVRACCNPAHLRPLPKAVHTMIGDNPPALNARKTHCPKGHAYSPENTYWVNQAEGGRWRMCRECTLARERRKREAAPKRPPRTTCERGHPWVPENVKMSPAGGRCRICSRMRDRERRARQKAQRVA